MSIETLPDSEPKPNYLQSLAGIYTQFWSHLRHSIHKNGSLIETISEDCTLFYTLDQPNGTTYETTIQFIKDDDYGLVVTAASQELIPANHPLHVKNARQRTLPARIVCKQTDLFKTGFNLRFYLNLERNEYYLKNFGPRELRARVAKENYNGDPYESYAFYATSGGTPRWYSQENDLDKPNFTEVETLESQLFLSRRYLFWAFTQGLPAISCKMDQEEWKFGFYEDGLNILKPDVENLTIEIDPAERNIATPPISLSGLIDRTSLLANYLN